VTEGEHVDDLASRVERRTDLLLHHAFPVLLVLASLVSAATARLLEMSTGAVVTSGLLVLGVATWHQVLVGHRWTSTRPDDRRSQVYVVGRTAVMSVLCVLNPFFALATFVGYFDVTRFAPRRTATVLVVVTAVSMAGSQSGGLPPTGAVQAAVFVALIALNAGLVLFFTWVDRDQANLADERVSTIEQLERTNLRLAEALAENEDLHAELLVHARESGRHEERERLALEIHDTIAQSLMAVLTQLEAARAEEGSTAGTELTERLHRATDLARGALGEARRSVEGLLPPALDGSDLVDALKGQVDEWSRRTGTPADAVVTGTVVPVPAEVDRAVLRVAGEALANVERHAAAGRVGVTLSFMHGELALDVRDDGVGMRGPAPEGRFGLTGMRRRAERLGGGLVLESEPGQGTAVQLRVPVVRGG